MKGSTPAQFYRRWATFGKWLLLPGNGKNRSEKESREAKRSAAQGAKLFIFVCQLCSGRIHRDAWPAVRRNWSNSLHGFLAFWAHAAGRRGGVAPAVGMMQIECTRNNTTATIPAGRSWVVVCLDNYFLRR